MQATRSPLRSQRGDARGRPRNKAIAAALGLVAGVLGLHRLYLRQRGWWLLPALALPLIGHALRQPVWYREPTFFVFALIVLVAWLQTIILCLMPAERFNARFNPEAPSVRGGVLAVVIAIVTLMLGSILAMSVLAIALEGLFVSSGT